MKTKIRKILSIICHSRKLASDSRKAGDKRSNSIIIRDMISLCIKHGISASRYMQYNMGTKTGEEREQIVNAFRDEMNWSKDYFANRRFLDKYTSRKYEKSSRLIKKRLRAYTDRYHLGRDCIIQFNVEFSREHYLNGTLKVGNKVTFAKNVFIDYSGEVIIDDNVKMGSTVCIESHHRDLEAFQKGLDVNIPTCLHICEGAYIGTHAIILDSCNYIGKHSRIGAGAVVTKDVPDYSVVVGVPAKVVKTIEQIS